MLQGDKPSSGFKTGGGDFDHIFEAHWEYCPDLLCFFYCLWNSGSSGKHFHFLLPVHSLLFDRDYFYYKYSFKKYGGIFVCLMVQTLLFLYILFFPAVKNLSEMIETAWGNKHVHINMKIWGICKLGAD